MEQTVGKIIEAIEKLADTLGRTVESLWPEIVRVYIVSEIASAGVLLVAIVVLAIIVNRLFKLATKSEDEDISLFGWVVFVPCLVALVVCSVAFLCVMVDVFRVIIAPEGHVALKLISKFATGG